MSGATSRNLSVSAQRIGADIAALAGITEPDRPYTRRAFTPMFQRGRAWLAQRFAEAGLEVHVDAAGNLIGRRQGRRPERGTIMLGSHSDTVPDGGRYDGIAGVIAALEVARALADRNITLDHDLEIVDFLAEEVSIFGISCIGSRGMTGAMPSDWLSRQAGDLTLQAGIEEVGGRPADLPARSRDDIKAFLELHIEQGPVLEAEGIDIGVVAAIAGITRIEITCDGRADHAGTTPMTARRDALVAGARLVTAIEGLALRQADGPAHFAATVGEFRIEPNAANVVPSHVAMLIDARAENRRDMDIFIQALDHIANEISTETGVAITTRKVSDNVPTPMASDVLEALDHVCDTLGISHRRMASGAGHDAAWLAKVTKAAMIFVPCVEGRSHAPEEQADINDITLGAAVLLNVVQDLDTACGSVASPTG